MAAIVGLPFANLFIVRSRPYYLRGGGCSLSQLAFWKLLSRLGSKWRKPKAGKFLFPPRSKLRLDLKQAFHHRENSATFVVCPNKGQRGTQVVGRKFALFGLIAPLNLNQLGKRRDVVTTEVIDTTDRWVGLRLAPLKVRRVSRGRLRN
jgi:hypothetical protein